MIPAGAGAGGAGGGEPMGGEPTGGPGMPTGNPSFGLGTSAGKGHHAALMLLRREALALVLARTAHPDGKQQMDPKVVKMPENHVHGFTNHQLLSFVVYPGQLPLIWLGLPFLPSL